MIWTAGSASRRSDPAVETLSADEEAASTEKPLLAHPAREWLGELLTNRAAVVAILGTAVARREDARVDR